MIEIFVIINMAVLALGGWVGYLIAEGKFTKEIDDLKHQPVNVKYVHANFVPVTVEKHIDPFTALCSSDPKTVESEIMKQMKRELADAVWPYVRLDHKDMQDDLLASHPVYRATIGVHATLWGDPHE